MRNTGGHLLPQFIGKALAFLIIADAHFGGDGEARRHRKADDRHFSQVRALATKQVLVARIAFRKTAAEAVDVLRHFTIPDRKSVGEGKSVSVRVGLGGRRSIKKKKTREQAITE